MTKALAVLDYFDRHKLRLTGGVYDARSYNMLSEMKDMLDDSFIKLARRHREGMFSKMYQRSLEE